MLLTPEETGALLNLRVDEVVGLVESGELAGLRVAGHWRIPLKSITALLAAGMQSQTARALERVFNDRTAWQQVFGAHPEVTQQIEAGEFPTGSVGSYLKQAIGVWRGSIGRAAPGAGHDVQSTGQDAEYGGGGDEEVAAGKDGDAGAAAR